MNKTLRIKGIEKKFLLNPGEIYNINIENSRFYYRLLNDLIDRNNDVFVYSVDHEIQLFDRHCLVINDLFNLDPNNKKILTGLYKKIADRFLSKEDNQAIIEINEKAMGLLEKISFDLNLPVEYDTELDISKLLHMYKFCFKDEFTTPLEKITAYLKANLEIFSFSFVITVNTLPLLNLEETELLARELGYLNLALINISLIQKSYSKTIQSITIDDDLCEY